MNEPALVAAASTRRPDHPDTPDSPQHAWHHALRLAAASERMIAQVRATLGLSSNEMNALLILHDGGDCTITELARRIQLSKAAVSALVDRMEHLGWLVRMPDAADRRRVRIQLTERFDAELASVTRSWRQRLQNLASATSDWSEVVDHFDEICRACDRTAFELADDLRFRRPDP